MKIDPQKKNELKVRDFRESLGLTRFDVRVQTGITERSLADIESGKFKLSKTIPHQINSRSQNSPLTKKVKNCFLCKTLAPY